VQHSESYYYDTHRQYSDTADYNTTNTEDIISEYNNDMGNHLNNMNQNTTSTYTQHNHIMMYKSMHYNAIMMIILITIRMILLLIIMLIMIIVVVVVVVELAIMVFRLTPGCNTQRVIIMILTGNTQLIVITIRPTQKI
jgi:hypothetical protein